MRKKQLGALLMSACMVASMTACGGGDEKEPTPTPTQAASPGNYRADAYTDTDRGNGTDRGG